MMERVPESAVKEIVDDSDDEEERVAGESTGECPKCGEAAVQVSRTSRAAAGPRPLPGFTICETDDGAAYYHRTDDD